MKCFVIVREESPGHFVAWPAGIPELKVTAESRSAVVSKLIDQVAEWGRTGQLVAVDVEVYGFPNPRWCVDPNDPMQIEYMEEFERYRREDREKAIREIEELERREVETQDTGQTPAA